MNPKYTLEKRIVCTLPDGKEMTLPYKHVLDHGNALFYIGAERDGNILWGIMQDFKVVVEPKFTALSTPIGNAIPACLGDKWGCISAIDGSVIVKFKYKTDLIIERCLKYDGVVQQDDRHFYIVKDGRWGVMNYSTVLIEPCYKALAPMYKDFIAAQNKNSKWGCINIKKRKVIVDFVYDTPEDAIATLIRA